MSHLDHRREYTHFAFKMQMRISIVNDRNNLPKFVYWPGITSNNHTGHIIHVIQKSILRNKILHCTMYTVEVLFTVLTRNMGQKIKTWENTVDPDKNAPLRMGSLFHCTRKIVAKEILR